MTAIRCLNVRLLTTNSNGCLFSGFIHDKCYFCGAYFAYKVAIQWIQLMAVRWHEKSKSIYIDRINHSSQLLNQSCSAVGTFWVSVAVIGVIFARGSCKINKIKKQETSASTRTTWSFEKCNFHFVYQKHSAFMFWSIVSQNPLMLKNRAFKNRVSAGSKWFSSIFLCWNT